MKRKLSLFLMIAAILIVIPLSPVRADSVFTFTTESDGWKKANDNTWTYDFDLGEDVLGWEIWESEVPAGYQSTADDKHVIENSDINESKYEIKNTARSYTLTLDPQGNTVAGANHSVDKVVKYKSDANNTVEKAERANYEFEGWWTAGGVQVFDAEGNSIVGDYWDSEHRWIYTGNVTVYPHWKAIYNIEYDLDEGSFAEEPVTSVKQGEVFEVAVPEKEYYDFVGWDISGMGNVTHYWDDADATTNTGNDVTADNVTATKFKNLTATGGATVTFKAVWQEKAAVAALVYDNNGRGTVPEPQDLYYTKEAKTSEETPEATGYTFKHWNTEPDDSGNSYSTDTLYKEANSANNTAGTKTIPGPTTLYAIWQAHTYNIEYDLAGGTFGAKHPDTATYDVAFTVNNPTRTGYTFKGWTVSGMDENSHSVGGTTTSATSVSGKTGTSFKNLHATQDATVNFTAVWTPVKVNLYLLPNTGTHNIITQTRTYDATSPSVTKPTKEGYNFEGWYKQSTQKSIPAVPRAPARNTKINVRCASSIGMNYLIHDDKYVYASPKFVYKISWPTSNSSSNRVIAKLSDTRSNSASNESRYSASYTATTLTAHYPRGTSSASVQYTGHISGSGATLNVVNNDKTRTITVPAQGTTNYGEKVYDASCKPVAGTCWDGSGSSATWKSTADVALVAKWSEKTATLTYNANGHGSVSTPSVTMKYTEATKAITLANVTGWQFRGWSTSKTATTPTYVYNEIVKAQNVVPSNMTLYAVWQPVKYSIEYDLDGGEVTGNPATAEYDTPVVIKVPEKDGYVFTGWTITGMDDTTHYWDSVNGSTAQGTSEEAAKIKATRFKNLRATSGTVTFTANWVLNAYDINYDLDGGTHGETHPSSAAIDDPFTVSDPTKEGYDFAGWEITGMDDSEHKYGTSATSNTTTNETSLTVEQGTNWFLNLRGGLGEIQFKALWTEKTGSLICHKNSHGENETITLKYTKAENLPNLEDVPGFDFNGWSVSATRANLGTTDFKGGALYKEANSLKNVKNAVVIPGETTVYASWDEHTAKLTINANGHGSSPAPLTMKYSAATSTPSPLIAEGYTFKSWNTKADGTGTSYAANAQYKAANTEPVAGELFAIWEEKTATIKYDANGHGTAPANQTVWYSKEAATPKGIQADGFTFKEWNTKSDGKGYSYKAETKFKNADSLKNTNGDTIIPGGDTLYAIWEEDSGVLTYDANGHGTSPDAVQMLYTKETKARVGLTAEGYKFKGWNTKADGTGTMLHEGDVYKAANSFKNVDGTRVLPDGGTLYAVWEELSGTLTFNKNGHGEDYEAQTLWYSKKFTMPVGKNTEGWIFKEWNTKANGTGKSYAIGETYKNANSLTNTNGNTVIPSGATVYAIWTEVSGELTYDANGHGEAPTPSKMRYSVETKTKSMEDVDGWVFMGWSTTKDGAAAERVDFKAGATYKQSNKLKNVNNETVLPAGATLYAVWVADEGYLTYDAQGHGTAPDAIRLRYAKEALVSEAAMKVKGYTFKEWNTKADGSGKAYEAGEVYKESASFKNTNGDKVVPNGGILYAIWIENTATLTYDFNYDDAETKTVTMKYTAEERTLTNIPSRGNGFTFKEWNTGRRGGGTGYGKGEVYKAANVEPEDATLYAIWNEQQATLKYDANGHGKAPADETLYYSKSFVIEGVVSADGYIFHGWNTRADGKGTNYSVGQLYKQANTVPVGITLYAVWTEEHHTMTVYGNGGTPNIKTYDLKVNSTQAVNVEMPSKSGLECTGLYTRKIGGARIFDQDGNLTNEGTFFKDGAFIYKSDFSLYAQYGDSAVECVVYDKNCDDDVSNMPANESKYLGKPIVLSGNIPTREGYTFVCWSTNPDGTGDCYYIQNGAGSVFPAKNDEAYQNYKEPVTLYAYWQQKVEGESADAKMNVTYNIYGSDYKNGFLDSEIVFKYKNFFLQDKEVKERRTIFVDGDQEIQPDVVIASPSWSSGDTIPGFENPPKPEKPEPTEPENPVVEEPEYTTVHNEAELRAAVKDFDYRDGDTNYIMFGNDISLEKTVDIPMDAKVSLDMENYKLAIGKQKAGSVPKVVDKPKSKAYVVLKDNGDFIFFRSSEDYDNNTLGTFTDIDGMTYTGRVFADIESYSYEPKWKNYVADIKTVRVANGQTISPVNCGEWFRNCVNMTSCDLKGFDTHNVTNMGNMFSRCEKMKSLDLSSFDTSNVTYMGFMFHYCKALESLDLSNFDTSNVTHMGCMFHSCFALTSLDLTSFDTSNVTRMNQMFYWCNSLKSLDLSSFDTRNVTSMDDMFHQCTSLKSLDLSSFDISEVATADSMFNAFGDSFDDQAVARIYASELWDITNISGKLFYTGLENLSHNMLTGGKSSTVKSISEKYGKDGRNIGNEFVRIDEGAGEEGLLTYKAYDSTKNAKIKTYAVLEGDTLSFMWSRDDDPKDGITDLHGTAHTGKVFSDIDSAPWKEYASTIKKVDVVNWIHPKTTAHWFEGCSELTTCNLSKLNTSAVTDMSDMFKGCSKLTTVDTRGFDTSKVTDMSGMFDGCTRINGLETTNFDTSRVTSFKNMFRGCEALVHVNVSNFDTSYVTDMSGMFDGCKMMLQVNVNKFDVRDVTTMARMFANCESLELIDVSGFNAMRLTDISEMFSGIKLASIDMSHFDTGNAQNMDGLFKNCTNLEEFDLSKLRMDNAENMDNLFKGCSKLKKIYVTADWTMTASGNNMFEDCTSLVGGHGTTYDPSHTGKEYAVADTARTHGYLRVPVAGESTPLKVLGELTVSNGTLFAEDACITVYDMGAVKVENDVTLDGNATYGVFFDGVGSGTADLYGTSVDSMVLCGTKNEHSLMTAKAEAMIDSSELYSDFTDKNPNGLVFEEVYTNANPENHFDPVDYMMQVGVPGDYYYRVCANTGEEMFFVVANADNDEAGVVYGGGEYRARSEVTLEAQPNEHYEFLGWYDENGEQVSSQNPWTFRVARHTVVTAKFGLIQHNIEITANDLSIGEVFGDDKCGETETYTITAQPAPGYAFVGWRTIEDGEESVEFVSRDPAYTTTMGTKDVSYKAYFSMLSYNVRISKPSLVPDDATTIMIGNEVAENVVNVESGETLELKAVINDEYKDAYTVAGWAKVVDGKEKMVCTTDTYSFAVTEDVDLVLTLDISDSEVERLISEFEEAQKDHVIAEFSTYREEYLDKAQPIGSVYTSTDYSLGVHGSEENPVEGVDYGVIAVQDMFGGKWERIENAFLYAQGSDMEIGDVGGKLEYDLALNMAAGNGFAFKQDAPTEYQEYSYDEFGLEELMYGKFGIGTVLPNGKVAVLDANQNSRTTSIVPPYQSVYVFRRVDEFKDENEISSGYWVSNPKDHLADGYTTESLNEDSTGTDLDKYRRGYRYKVVSEFEDIEAGSLTQGFFRSAPPDNLLAEGYSLRTLEEEEAEYQQGYRYEVVRS